MSDSPGDLLSRLCSNAQSLVIAAPYIKADALSRILAVSNAEASLTCVTRWSPHDLSVGASDTECRNLVIDFGGSFLLHPTLHAKYYRTDDMVLVGSANLTSSAMGWSPEPNLEILCRAGADLDAVTFERQLLVDSREVTDDEFRRWEAIGRVNAPSDGSIAETPARLSAWRPMTRDPRHLELSYRGKADEIASYDEQKAAQRDLQSLLIPSGLTDKEVQAWASTCLLAAPFTCRVIQLHSTEDPADSYRVLARTFGLGITEARRDMETVQNWLAFFAPETLQGQS